MNGQVARHVETVATPRGREARPSDALRPLVLDLDAALPAGFAWELGLGALRARPTSLADLVWALLRRDGSFEAAACAVPGAADAVPLQEPARAALAHAAKQGRPVLLLTGAHAAFARALQQASPWVRDVVDVPADDPLADLARLAALRVRCPNGFVVQDSEAGSWAQGAVTLPSAFARDGHPPTMASWVRALRVHQWAKNGLVFVPPILAGQAGNPAAWLLAVCAFLAFGIAASATYLLNDLHDLDHDRAHRSKRYRPLASGALAIPHALAAIGLGLVTCMGLAAMGGLAGFATLGAYLALTLAYTFAIKRLMVLDTVTLAGLFTLRLVAGTAFCGVAGSAWLLAFSMVVFTALALAKRFVEIEAARARGGASAIAGRGYTVQDGSAVLALGAGMSAAAVLILALYVVETSARNPFYANPELLWAAPVALFVWLGRIWILCGRGQLRDDPVEFALTDRPSLALGLVIAASFALACAPI